MSKKVTVVDYGIGNLLSVCRALTHEGGEVTLSGDPDVIRQADHLVVPGVGAFGQCTLELATRNLREPVLEFLQTGRPTLGICVGMQMLFEIGEEFGEHQGLGVFPGRVVAIDPRTAEGGRRKIPHIGWNRLQVPAGRTWGGTMLAPVQPGESVYFVHSFSARCERPEDVLATVDYEGYEVVAAVARDNVMGTQFHPEKSGDVGLRIVRAFLNL